MMKKKVVVVEDDSNTFDILKYLIAESGHEVMSVTDIVQFEKVTECKPDLFLINDWQPGSVGYWLCQQVKTNLLITHVPVILLSTNPFITELSRSFRADDYLPKPVDLQELVDKVIFWLAQSNFHAN